jgi:hypothetical protein
MLRWMPTVLAAILAALASTAARADQSSAGDEPLGAAYRLQAYRAELRADPYRLFVFLRVAPEGSKIKACGVYIVDASDRRNSEIVAAFRDMSSGLRLGAGEARGVRLRPSFFAAKRALVHDDLDGKPKLPLADLRANCVIADGPWQDRFAVEPFTLDLRQTRIKSLVLPYR